MIFRDNNILDGQNGLSVDSEKRNLKTFPVNKFFSQPKHYDYAANIMLKGLEGKIVVKLIYDDNAQLLSRIKLEFYRGGETVAERGS